MINIINKNECCGCGACEQRCPKHCIILQEDEEGFAYPYVNLNECINCNLCEKVCPFLNKKEERYPIKIYASKNKNYDVRINSSSGGLFVAIATIILRKGGVVFGAKFDSNWDVVLTYTDNERGLIDFQGSKYIQATVGNSFKDAENFLKAQRLVLFSGTSCQIAALKNFLKKDYDNLFTIDFICHGVPNKKLFHEFLNEEIHRHYKLFRISHIFAKPQFRYKIKSIKFREKSYGWKRFCFKLTITNQMGKSVNIIHSIFSDTTFGTFFLSNLSLRPSCYNCPAKSGRARSDLTLGDFWGINKFYEDFDDDKGVSLVIVNTNKGAKIIPFKSIDFIEPSFEEAFAKNQGYFKSVEMRTNRDKFWELHREGYGLKFIYKVMFPLSFTERVKKIIKKFIITKYLDKT